MRASGGIIADFLFTVQYKLFLRQSRWLYPIIVTDDFSALKVFPLSVFFLGSDTSLKSKYLFIRIYRRHEGNSGYFHTLRTIQHRTADDARSK